MGMLQKYFGVKKYQHFPTDPFGRDTKNNSINLSFVEI